MKCQECGGELTIQPSLADNYKLLFCYNMKSYKTKDGSRLCGYRGYLKDGVVVEKGKE